MKIRLYDENLIDGGINNILKNRGIKEVEKWKNANWDDINSPYLFGEERVEKAVDFLRDAVQYHQRVCVIVDADCDGYTSAAIIINYLDKLISWNNETDNISYILHEGKQHGLEDTFDQISDDTDLVIIPDAGRFCA